jgi:Adenylosuccinate lyase C-terminus
MRAWKEGLDFQQLVLADPEITGKVPRKQIEHAFDLPRQLKNVDKIFARVFGKGNGPAKTHSAARLANPKKKRRAK